MATQPYAERSWWSRLLGRSLLSAVVGSFFERKSNATSVIAIALVFTLCYVVVVKEQFKYMEFLVNVIFVVIGYYFGTKQQVVGPEEE